MSTVAIHTDDRRRAPVVVDEGEEPDFEGSTPASSC
jgi:hypothetical protein